MATDLKKMVEELSEKHLFSHSEIQLLLAMAAEIKANREEIEKLKETKKPSIKGEPMRSRFGPGLRG